MNNMKIHNHNLFNFNFAYIPNIVALTAPNAFNFVFS